MKSTSVKMRESTHRTLKVTAAQEGRDMGDVLEDALRAYFEKRGRRGEK